MGAEDLAGQGGKVLGRVRDEGWFLFLRIRQDLTNVPVSSKWAESYAAEVRTPVLEMQMESEEHAARSVSRWCVGYIPLHNDGINLTAARCLASVSPFEG